MANPYLDKNDTKPIDSDPVAAGPYVPVWVAWIIGIAAFAGLFLPSDRFSLPIPDDIPFVEPVIDLEQTKGSWVVVIEETEQRTPDVIRLLDDTPYWQSLLTRGLKYRHYDDDSDDAKKYEALVTELGLPMYTILGGEGALTGKVLAKGPLPRTKESMDKIIKDATGR